MDFDGHTLRWGERSASALSVEGFREHFSTFTGRAWMSVEGPGWRVPIGEGYGQIRADLRRWFPDRPFTADWADGRFPSARFGLPCDLLLWTGGGVILASSMVLSGWVGPVAGATCLAAGIWPLARLRDAIVVRDTGIRIGPSWAPTVPWCAVEGVTVIASKRTAQVWVDTDRGTEGATLPTALVPALRARVWRLGGVDLDPRSDPVDMRYGRWQGPATAAPWGVLLGTSIGACFVDRPWQVLIGGLLVMAALAMLAAAVEARSTGWGAGGVFWFTGVYATVLLSLVVGALL